MKLMSQFLSNENSKYVWYSRFFFTDLQFLEQCNILNKLKSDSLTIIDIDRSPTHAGGLFAIHRAYFEELGWYDEGLEIWGGEQYELSFKVWQCGGSLLWVPCSHVGHIYKRRSSIHPDILPEKLVKKGSLVHLNHRRVAETWMDEYKEYLYIRVDNKLTLCKLSNQIFKVNPTYFGGFFINLLSN
jgi:hypothetical protein